MYVGLLDVIATNASKNFVSKEFINNAKTIAIKINKVPVKAHNSISKVEQYYTAICCTFKVISTNIGSNALPNHIL
jgi:hypothetical protein